MPFFKSYYYYNIFDVYYLFDTPREAYHNSLIIAPYKGGILCLRH